MSGIAVIYHLDGRPVDSLMIDRMLDAIAHRGRDGIRRWTEGPIAIGHAMRHTTPESVRELQPLRDDMMCLTFDGRVDNREELRCAIESAGAPLKTDTDGELVLRAYQCWGMDSPRRILGDFAYAIWDGRKRELFCARDPLGIKPFFYYCDARVFLCGSEAQEILADPRVHRVPNEPMVAEYLAGSFGDREETFYRGVMRLAGGDLMVVRPRGIARSTWFAIDPAEQIRYPTDQEYAEHLRGLIAEAVRCRMRSIGGVAAQLSGGLDSSSVVGMAQKLMRDGRVPSMPFETFSLDFAQPESNESPEMRAVVEMWDLKSNLVEPQVSTFDSCLEQVRRFKDIPVPTHAEVLAPLYSQVAAKGFRVCLTGLGGDDWMFGSRYAAAALLARLKFIELAKRLRYDWFMLRRDRNAFLRRSWGFARYSLMSTLTPLVPQRAQQLMRLALGRENFPRWIEPRFARDTHLAERLRQKLPSPRSATPQQRDKYEHMVSPMPIFFLEAAERACSWAGFELRHPLHDLRIVAFALATPEDQRRRGIWQRFGLRQAMRNLLPEKVLWRLDKGHFSDFNTAALKNYGEAGVFESPAVGEAGWVAKDKLRQAYHETISLYARGRLPFYKPVEVLLAASAAEIWFGPMFHDARNLQPNSFRGHELRQPGDPIARAASA